MAKFVNKEVNKTGLPEELPTIESGEVKTKGEKFKGKIDAFFDRMLDGFANIQTGVGEFFLDIGYAAEDMLASMKEEILDCSVDVVNGSIWLYNHLGHRMHAYYERNPEKKVQRRRKNRALMRKFIRVRNRVIHKEKELARKMVHFINHVDDKNDELADKTNVMVKKGNKHFNFAREWADINKKKLLINFGIVVGIAVIGVSVLNYFTAYEYAYNGRTLGVIKRQEDVLKVADIMSEQLSKEHNAQIYIDREDDITFKRVLSVDRTIDDTEQVLKRLTYMKNMNAKAYAIYIDGKRAVILDSEESAKKALEDVKSTYTTASTGVEYEKVSFKEEVAIKQIDTKLGYIQSLEEAMQKLMTGAVFQEVHVVVSGDTLSGIAKTYGMTISELREANPTITPERLSIGQEIVLTKPAPMVTVKTVEVATYIDKIPYETEYEDTKSLYKGEKQTKVEGVDGEKEITARITRENGIAVATKELKSKVLSEPTTEIILKGTKELPPLQGTGRLKYPLSSYRLTSKFGMRWGRMHNGIDMANSTGTPIRAADGGTVIFSGYSGSYGYVVKINHGGNMVTVYAHCSKLHVRKGERVYQGQHIANVGNTGRSTGPHLHFEVQVNGTPKNPLNYL